MLYYFVNFWYAYFHYSIAIAAKQEFTKRHTRKYGMRGYV